MSRSDVMGGQADLDAHALEPHHTAYLLSDEGTYRDAQRQPRLRQTLERYIKTETTSAMLAAKGKITQNEIFSVRKGLT